MPNFELEAAWVLAETLTLTAVSPKTYGAQAKFLAALKSNPRDHGELQVGWVEASIVDWTLHFYGIKYTIHKSAPWKL